MRNEYQQLTWKECPWFQGPTFNCYRQGRFIVAELDGQHLVLSTSSRVGGMRSDIRYLVNHQSCEGAGHSMRGFFIMRLGMDGYHDSCLLYTSPSPRDS